MRANQDFQVFLGNTKDTGKPVYLKGFKWECGWYWAGGYVVNNQFHTHFNGCFLNVPDYRGHPLGNFTPQNIYNGCSIWEPLSTFLDNSPFTETEWWRIKDLYKQFYAFQATAEAFQFGGHCSSFHSANEINQEMAKKLNDHIELVIIPEIKKALRIGS